MVWNVIGGRNLFPKLRFAQNSGQRGFARERVLLRKGTRGWPCTVDNFRGGNNFFFRFSTLNFNGLLPGVTPSKNKRTGEP